MDTILFSLSKEVKSILREKKQGIRERMKGGHKKDQRENQE